MINLIAGPKGSGKTKTLLTSANETGARSKGDVVYVTDNAKHGSEVHSSVRFIDAAERGISGKCALLGFIKGILAADNDITDMFIDGAARIAGCAVGEMEDFYSALELCGDGVDFTLTVSAEIKELPPFMRRYT